VHHLFLLSYPISIPFSHSPTGEWIDFCEDLFVGMLDSNYTAFKDNAIGAVRQMAFGSSSSLFVYDRGILHYVVLDVVYCHMYLVYTFQKFACLPSGDRYLYCFVPYEL